MLQVSDKSIIKMVGFNCDIKQTMKNNSNLFKLDQIVLFSLAVKFNGLSILSHNAEGNGSNPAWVTI